MPLGLRVPAASGSSSAHVAVVMAFRSSRSPQAGPELLFIPVKWHRRTDGRNDVAWVSRQWVLMAGALVSKSSLRGRVWPPRPLVAPFTVVRREARPRLLHHTAAAAPGTGRPGAPAAPHAWDSRTAIFRCISLLFYPLGNLQIQQIDKSLHNNTKVMKVMLKSFFKPFTPKSHSGTELLCDLSYASAAYSSSSSLQLSPTWMKSCLVLD